MWKWCNKNKQTAAEQSEPTVTPSKAVRLSELAIYLSNNTVLRCNSVLADNESELVPFDAFHKWMMGPSSSTAFFLTIKGGGYYIKRDSIMAYTILAKGG